MLEIGSVFEGKYKIKKVIGQGGMSTVYLALNERAGKYWAIKEIRKEGIENYSLVKQSLITEVSLLKNLSHPYIPTIVDVVDKDDSILVVMDFIEGKSLKKYLEENGSFSEEEVTNWAKQICDVLIYLHSRNPKIIYRDLKPGNIMLRPNGTICLIDFGTAREYKVEEKGDTIYLGTRGYAAPEQFGGQGQTDERTDIYCLGTTMYHLLTGHNPSEPPYEMYPVRQWNPLISQGLEKIIEKCTRQNPDERYSSATEVLYDLENTSALEEDYRNKAKGRIRIFTGAASLALIFGILSFTFGNAAGKEKEDAYVDYIDEARIEIENDDRFSYYVNALDVDSSKAEAYLKILNEVYLVDDNYSASEDEQLTEILLTSVGGKETRQEVLEKNPEEYSEFCYYRALSYFYSYEGKGNKPMSAYWFDKAAESGTLEESKQERAIRLGKIAGYYTSIGKDSVTGDSEVSFKEYWKDLCAICQGNIASMDNPTTALMIYEEMAGQIYMYASDFRKSGVEVSEMKEYIDSIRQHMEKDISKEKIESSERLTNMSNNLNRMMEKAEISLSEQGE